MNYTFVLFLFLFAMLANAGAQTVPPPAIPSDADIQANLADRVPDQNAGVGIVVGIIGPTGRRVIASGNTGTNDSRPVSGDTVFAIGGITKVFTALLLADMAQRHELALADPISKYLPKNIQLRESVRRITLQDLATHTSGLPRDPTNVDAQDARNAYAEYSPPQLYQFLSGLRLRAAGPATAEYSNVGYGLLGHLLALRARSSYAALVRTRISTPLGMKSTGVNLSPTNNALWAPAHDPQQQPLPDLEFDVLSGAGAMRSTANDLLTLLAGELAYSNSPLSSAMASMLKIRRPTETREFENGLGWQVSRVYGREIVQKDGVTLGGDYASFVAFDPNARVGVVVLANAYAPNGVSDIGLHVLDPRFPLRGMHQREIAVEPARLDAYVGRYRLSPNVVITVTRNGSRLFAQMTGQPQYEIFPAGGHSFFYKSFDAQLVFETDATGRALSVMTYYGRKSSRAERIAAPADAK